MSCPSYSRNKYRCLLRPNHNVIVPNDNINETKQGPQPRIYPYGYPGIYPGYGYSYPDYGYGYPDYGYSYPDYGYGYPGVYPGTRLYPYVANEKKPRSTPTPKNEKMSEYEYYSSSSSSSSDDECDRHPYRCNPERYYRRYTTHNGVSPQRVFDEQNQKPFPIPKPTPNPPIHRPPRPRPPPPPPVPASEMNHPDNEEMPIKNKKQFAKPFAKLLTKLTTPLSPNDPIVSNESNEKKENDISLGDSNLLEFKNEEPILDSSCNLSNMNETKIYLKV